MLPLGKPGAVTRPSQSTIEALPADGPLEAWGQPVEVVNGKVTQATGTSAYGVLVRPYPQQEPPNPANVLRRGYIAARIDDKAHADTGAPVYIVAGVFSASRPSNNPRVGTFMNDALKGGSVEIAFNI